MLDLLNPVRSAIFARDQCAVFGADSSVATTTSSTCSAVIDGGRPGRSSLSPSSRSSTNRARHLPTVGCDTRSRTATFLFDNPAAQPSTIRARYANACDEDRRAAHRCSCSRSASVNVNSAFGRPLRSMKQNSTYATN